VYDPRNVPLENTKKGDTMRLMKMFATGILVLVLCSLCITTAEAAPYNPTTATTSPQRPSPQFEKPKGSNALDSIYGMLAKNLEGVYAACRAADIPEDMKKPLLKDAEQLTTSIRIGSGIVETVDGQAVAHYDKGMHTPLTVR